MNHDDDDAVPGLERLRMEREPSRDLWPGIQARIAPPRRAAWSTMAAAACMVFAVAALIGIATLRGPLHPPAASSPAAVAFVAPAASTAASPSAPFGATRTLVRANLKIVSDAERQLERAIAADPKSAYLQNLLLATREQRRQLNGRLSAST